MAGVIFLQAELSKRPHIIPNPSREQSFEPANLNFIIALGKLVVK